MKNNLLFLFLFGLSSLCSAQTSGINFHSEDWKEASELARKENKLIFIDGYTTWCAPCKIMEEHVFTYKACGDLYNSRFINMRMDMEKNEGPLFVSRYGVNSYPAFLYLSWDGTLIYKTSGYRNIDHLVADGYAALEPYRYQRAMDDRFNDGDRMPDFLFHYTYFRKVKNDGSHQEILPLYLEAQTDWTSPMNLAYVFDFVDSFDSRMFSYMAANKSLFRKEIGKDIFDIKFNAFVNEALANRGNALSLEEREEIILKAYPESADFINLQYRMEHYRNLADDKAYAQSAYEFYTTYTPEDKESIRADMSLFKSYLDKPEQRALILIWAEEFAREENLSDAWMDYAKLLLENNLYSQAVSTARQAVKMAKSEGREIKSYKQVFKMIKSEVKGKI